MEEVLFSRTIGRVTLTVREEDDNYPDLSYLGEYGDLPERVASGWVYSRRTGAVTRDGVTWHDARGRFVNSQACETWDNRHEHGWILVDCGQETCAHAISDAERLLGHGESWGSVGLVASCVLDGVEVGSSSCWGYESDCADYLESEARSLAREALREAIAWMERVA